MTDPLTDQRIEEIEGALDADFTGPFWSTPAGGNHAFITDRRRDLAEVLDCGEQVGPLIAMALNALPELLAEVRRLRDDRNQLARAFADANDALLDTDAACVRLGNDLGARDAELAAVQVEREDLQAAYHRLGDQAQRIVEAASRFRAERDQLHDALTGLLLGSVGAAWESSGAGDVRSPWIPAGEVALWRQLLARTERSERDDEALAATPDAEAPPDWHHCAMCGERCYWQESPHGGWWAHEVPCGGDHDAVAGAPCRPGADDYCEPPTEAPQNGPAAPAGGSRSPLDAQGGEVAQRGAAGRDGHTEADTDRARRAEIARALHEYADRLDAVPLNCTALTGPVWYGAGWRDAVGHLRDLADGLMPAPAAGDGGAS